MKRLAVITSHPIQYYAPWFRFITQHAPDFQLKVFYLWDFGVSSHKDPEFGERIVWDVPLLEGYEYEFVPNVSGDPGTHHFGGLKNPTLLTQVNQWHPDAALLIGFNHAGFVSFILRAGSLPLVFRGDSHLLNSARPSLRETIKFQLRRIIFSRFHAFLAVGSANQNYFLQHRIPIRRIFLSSHCVDNARFLREATPEAGRKWREQFQVSLTERVILFAGKFSSKKCPNLLLEAFAALRPDNACLLFVGAGECEAHLRKRSAELDLNVRFAPFQNQSAMPATYAAADVFVLPSSGSRETWGLAINEAMASGIPAIVSSVVGCGPDLVIPGKTGWIFPANNVGALTECLRSALADDANRQQMGNNARQLVTEHFNYERATAGLVHALNAIKSSAC